MACFLDTKGVVLVDLICASRTCTVNVGYYATLLSDRWLGSRMVSVLDSALKGPGSNRSRYAVG